MIYVLVAVVKNIKTAVVERLNQELFIDLHSCL